MKLIYLSCIFFAIACYLALPTDAEVINPSTPSQDTRILVTNENGCAVYQEPYRVGENLQPVVDVECGK